jgi:DNA-directed RNA polymerase specialized sigma24 family protein
MLARRGYIATHDDLVEAALNVAEVHVRRRMHHSPDRSQDLCDLIQNVTSRAVRSCERNWRPEKSPLRAFVSQSVKYALKEEYRNSSLYNDREDEIVQVNQRETIEKMRSNEHAPRFAELADEAKRQRQAAHLEAGIAQLPAAQRAEMLRRLGGGAVGTNQQAQVFKRAKTNLQKYFAEHPLADN